MQLAFITFVATNAAQRGGGDGPVPGDDDFEDLVYEADETERVVGMSLMRDVLVQQVFHSGLSRPRLN